jgi:hypothetical protein
MLSDDQLDVPVSYVTDVMGQLQNSNLEPGYKNKLLKSFKPCLMGENQPLFDILMVQLSKALDTVVV